jgi:hypothetical protein
VASLDSTEEPGTYVFNIEGINSEGNITVSVDNVDGYSITPSSLIVRVHYCASPVSIKERLGLSTGAAVQTVFYALHGFIQGGGLSTGKIQLGDWIDLDSLKVEAYGDGGAIDDGEEGPLPNDDLGGDKGYLLRLIVVGINSFQSGRGRNPNGDEAPTYNGDTNGLYTIAVNDGTPHVVFQFQNIPVQYPMYASSSGNYRDSDMRRYLTKVYGDDGTLIEESGNFLEGLYHAGVPENVLWAPKRYVARAGTGQDVDEIEDLLWLPTVREFCGGGDGYRNTGAETDENQAFLEYREKAWLKYAVDGSTRYWLSSLTGSDFAINTGNGGLGSRPATVSRGVAPAFCVK